MVDYFPEWQRVDAVGRIRAIDVTWERQYRKPRDVAKVPTEAGRLVAGSLAYVGGKERGIYWASSEVPAIIGLISTGHIVKPVRVITNNPDADTHSGDPIALRVGDERYSFHYTNDRRQQHPNTHDVNRYVGSVMHRLAEGPNRIAHLTMDHFVLVDCSSVPRRNTFEADPRFDGASDLRVKVVDAASFVDRLFRPDIS